MRLEDQCVSLILAKQLKEVGVPQGSYFWWVKDMFVQKHPDFIIENAYRLENWKDQYSVNLVKEDTYYSAFTASELGELLGKNIEITIDFTGDGYRVVYVMEDFWHKNLAEALGQELLYLKKQGLI